MTDTETPAGTALEVHDFAPARKDMREEVLAALAGQPRSFPSHYLYDDRGSKLFDAICDTKDYYVTRTELAIMQEHMNEIVARLGPRVLLIEPGSGSGLKTRLLLAHLDDPAGYVPVEISRDHLERSALQLREEFPDLLIVPICADFHGDFEIPPLEAAPRRRAVYFPGSTIGNFEPEVQQALLRRMRELAGPEGGVLIGADRRKDRAVLEAAYNDSEGVSRAFALNILDRLNRELGADFDVARFDYEAPYDERNGRIEMRIVSRADQTVRIAGQEVRFAKDEPIRTEWSYKFTPELFAERAASAGLRVEQTWTDPKQWFSLNWLVADK